jgi:hypothetical protein
LGGRIRRRVPQVQVLLFRTVCSSVNAIDDVFVLSCWRFALRSVRHDRPFTLSSANAGAEFISNNQFGHLLLIRVFIFSSNRVIRPQYQRQSGFESFVVLAAFCWNAFSVFYYYGSDSLAW